MIYFAGLAIALSRLRRAWQLWRAVLDGAQQLDRRALGAHGGFDAHQLSAIARHRLVVMETDAAVSPMLVGVWRPVLLLPRHLRGFPVIEQQLVIAHELQHWRARDPWVLGLSALVQTLLWFNPAPRRLGARLAWAVELACDRRVLAGRPARQRKQYAGALLAQWRAQLIAPPATALAFGTADAHTASARIAHLRHADAARLPAAGAWAVTALLIVALTGTTLLRPALAVEAAAVSSGEEADEVIGEATAGLTGTASDGRAANLAGATAGGAVDEAAARSGVAIDGMAASLAGTTAGGAADEATVGFAGAAAAKATAGINGATAAGAAVGSTHATAIASGTSTNAATAPRQVGDVSAIAWRHPLDKMRVSGFFGVMRSVSPRPSIGLDLPAPVGTPVRAAAAGTVLAAGPRTENNGRYGTAVMVVSRGAHDGPERAATEALYAHLATTTVRPGDQVVAGQVIGTVGVTGFSTGPHLHFQLRRHGQAFDPASVLPGLDRYATRHALTVRRQQLGY